MGIWIVGNNSKEKREKREWMCDDDVAVVVNKFAVK
jgi:hypothetical protein